MPFTYRAAILDWKSAKSEDAAVTDFSVANVIVSACNADAARAPCAAVAYAVVLVAAAVPSVGLLLRSS